MAIGSACVWEVRAATGSDTNGGGFIAGASGTDWSQQASPQYSVTDGVTAGTTTITSATAAFGTDVVGNIIYVQGGTGSIVAGWYQITARASALSITVDRSTGLTAGTGVTLHIGGCFATIGAAATVATASNKIYVKSGTTYTTTTTITFAAGNNNPHTRIIGYTTTRGDGGKPTLQLSTSTGFFGVTMSAQGIGLENFIIDCNSLATSSGVTMTSTNCYCTNVKVMNYTGTGINAAATNLIYQCEITAGSSTPTAAITMGVAYALFNYIHDGVGPGIVVTANSSGTCIHNIVDSLSGATSDGIVNAGINLYNSVNNCGQNGISTGTGSSSWINWVTLGNIMSNNAGVGLKGATANTSAMPATPMWDGNAFYNNTGGNRANADSVVGQNNVAPYTNIYDLTLSGIPYTNQAGKNYGLNATAGAGGACRNSAPPTAWPGASTTAFSDMGAVQHNDPGVVTINPNFAA